MKVFKFISALFLALSLQSCEEVIDLELDTAAPKLVVDASIKWQKGTSGNQQIIRLSTTAPYFDNVIPGVANAVVYITDLAGNSYDFLPTQTTGEYLCTSFLPVLNETYTLTVIHDNQTYTAVETLRGVPMIDEVLLTEDAGFSGEDTEVKVFFTDDDQTTDFYLVTLLVSDQVLPNYQVQNDNFTQGNQSFGLFNIEDLESGDQLQITLAGLSEQYHNYLRILLSIAGGGSGSPFQSPPVTVRGNLVNQTDFDNFALGYFSLSEVDSRELTID